MAEQRRFAGRADRDLDLGGLDANVTGQYGTEAATRQRKGHLILYTDESGRARTFLLAHEFGRNAGRSFAKANALESVAERLRGTSGTSSAELFRDVWAAEYVIESDQREWLRLMIEAEWFG